jgi:pimeloyl-ACP methyl ester carboxylesterase
VGNSLGGWLAIELARRGRATSVVAMAPGGGWRLGSREHRRLLRKFKTTKALLSIGGPLAGVLAELPLARRMFFSDVVARPERLSPADAKLFIESAWRCATYGNVLKVLPTQPLSEPLSPLPCPVRLVWGEKDRLLPLRGYSEHWRQVLPGAEWVVLEDVGHVQMYDDPDAVAASVLELTARGAAVEVTPQPAPAEPQRLAG